MWQTAARLYNSVIDLLEARALPFSGTFRNQLERAALSVSNNIAEGFERATTAELLCFLAIARGSGGEVRSMIALIKNRPGSAGLGRSLEEIRELADSCVKQLTAWTRSIEASPVQGKRHLTRETREKQRAAQAAQSFRLNFLRNLKAEHPLYHSPEARVARGEAPA